MEKIGPVAQSVLAARQAKFSCHSMYECARAIGYKKVTLSRDGILFPDNDSPFHSLFPQLKDIDVVKITGEGEL